MGLPGGCLRQLPKVRETKTYEDIVRRNLEGEKKEKDFFFSLLAALLRGWLAGWQARIKIRIRTGVEGQGQGHNRTVFLRQAPPSRAPDFPLSHPRIRMHPHAPAASRLAAGWPLAAGELPACLGCSVAAAGVVVTQEGGAAKVPAGAVSPSAGLSASWVLSYRDIPRGGNGCLSVCRSARPVCPTK